MAGLFRRRKEGVPSDAESAWARHFEAALCRRQAPAGYPVPQGLPVALGRDAASFVLTGSPGGVLAEISRHQAATSPRGTAFHGSSDQDSELVVRGLVDLSPDAVLRFGLVVEATAFHHFPRYELDAVGGARWPEHVVEQIMHAFRSNVDRRAGGALDRVPVPVGVLEGALAAAGRDPIELWSAAFREAQASSYSAGIHMTLAAMVGYSSAVERHADALSRQMSGQGATANLLAIEMLTPLPDQVLRRFAPAVAAMVTAGSSQLRTAAAPLAARCGAAMETPLRELVTTGSPEARRHALRALWDLGDAAARTWASDMAAADRAASVRALAEEWARASRDLDASTTAAVAVERPPVQWAVEVTAEGLEWLEALRRTVNEQIEQRNDRERAYQAAIAAHAGQPAGSIRLTATLPGSWVKDTARELGRSTPPVPRQQAPALVEPATLVAQVSGFGPEGVLRLLNTFVGLVSCNQDLADPAVAAVETLHAQTGHPTLLELSDLLDSMGMDGPGVGTMWAPGGRGALGADWPDADVAPFAQLNAARFAKALCLPYRDYAVSTPVLIRILGRIPVLPDDVARLLFEFALTGFKANRPAAREACARMRDRDARLMTALSDGKADVRAEAARWLAGLRLESAVPALEAAVAKERHDVAKGAMLDALEAVGRPVERYLDRVALAAEGAKGLAKGLPKDLGWLQWASVPEVRWADSGEVVPATTLQWLVAQAVRARSTEPNAVLRKYCGMLESTSREAFGQYLLEAWLAADVRPVDPQIAAADATGRAQWLHQMMQQSPHAFADDPKRTWSVQELTSWYLPTCLREPAGSAIGSKGVLAVAAACAGERAAAPVGAYLKEWYGTRAAQGKALIGMLAWIDHPTAVQLMLSVGSRFRTKSFQEEATRQAEAMAERRGWTVAELADRTIPTAGLDEAGVLELSFGPRVFRAVLGADLTLALQGPDGESIRTLPAPRQSDDAELAKAAKKLLAGAKKQLGALVTMQSERMYEAMCTERAWPFDDWERYLARHPVMRHLVQRLVWTASSPDGRTVAFRPLDDGTLTDAEDAAVTLAVDAVVRVAHASALTAAEVSTWERHLEDYEVTPLFRQLGAGAPALAEDAAAGFELTDFRGHLVEAFRLRGRAAKLGYTRGAPVDGGWFMTYEKRFPTIGLTTVVQFSGNSLPEENRTVALETLSFERLVGESWSRPRIRLVDVPRVLLDEAYADLRATAADGTGYDPDWQKKVGP